MVVSSRKSSLAGTPVSQRHGLPVPKVGTAVAIATRLRSAIADGIYVDGERLPAERDLAEAFASSRTTVREALHLLSSENLVSRRVGSGTFVTFSHDTENPDIAEITSPLELIEVRIAVEPHMVRLATVHATLRDLDRIAGALRVLESSGEPESFTRHDRIFHQSIADATHNPLMCSFYRRINHVRGHRQWNLMKDKVLTQEAIEAYNLEHRLLCEALSVRNADHAADIVLGHLHTARQQLVST